MPSPDYAFTVLVIIFISKIHNPLEHRLNALNTAVLTLRVTRMFTSATPLYDIDTLICPRRIRMVRSYNAVYQPRQKVVLASEQDIL